MYQENEDDWKILKEFKQKKRNSISNDRERAKKVGNRAARSKPRVEGELQTLYAEKSLTNSPRDISNINLRLEEKQKLLEAIDHDIQKATELEGQYAQEIDLLNQQISEIDAKIKENRRKQNEQQILANQEKKDPIQKCPKKCRIDSVQINCSHNKSLSIEPYEGEMPILHVLTRSGGEKQEIVDVMFGGSCDHGKSQSASDSEKYKEKNRSFGADQYCPRVNIVSASEGTDIQRPSKTRFLATVDEFQSNSTPVGFLFNHLLFSKEDDPHYDAREYDVSFVSCQGDLPYKALVIAYPENSWNVEFSFGYTAKYDKHEVTRKFAKDKVDSFDGMKCNGKWNSSIKASYVYDIYKNEIEQELNFDDLLKELKGSWNVLEKLAEFFSPVNGFIESAMGYSGEDERKFDNKLNKAKNKNKMLSEHKTVNVQVLWPCLKLSGNYQRIETNKGAGIGGQGKLKVEFAPLFGVTGKIDIVQLLLHALGSTTGFGKFLAKVVNMSAGTRKSDGSLDKSKSYVETNIELFFGATSNVSGSVGWQSDPDKGWHAAAGDIGVSGFIGLILEGKAKVEGKVWVVKVGAGAEFRTTDESGTKVPGLEISYKPTVINNEFSWAGALEFNGLAITWALYSNVGAEAETQDSGATNDRGGKKFGKAKAKLDRDVKMEKRQIIFKKRRLLGGEYVNKIGT
ncbi:hypothetical protein TDB9533_04781 [Thalassocella blandensis]|nr:hypothetical protein TDB9533_04781 [Thalassocella blandensis]